MVVIAVLPRLVNRHKHAERLSINLEIVHARLEATMLSKGCFDESKLALDTQALEVDDTANGS